MRLNILFLMGGLVACGGEPARSEANRSSINRSDARGDATGPNVASVVDARCPMPAAEGGPSQWVSVFPVGGCETATLIIPDVVVRDGDGRDVFAGATLRTDVTVETNATACIFRVGLTGVVRPKKPEDEPTTPSPVDVRAGLCNAHWSMQLPLTGIEEPVLRNVRFIGEGHTVTLPGSRRLSVGILPEPVRCTDASDVEVDDFVLGLRFDLEVPHSTLMRTSSRAVRGQAVITFDIQPR